MYDDPGSPPDADPEDFIQFEQVMQLPTIPAHAATQDDLTDAFVRMISHNAADLRMVHELLMDYMQDWVPSDRTELVQRQMLHLDVIPREIEEQYMRTSRPGDVRCCREDDCEGMKLNIPRPVPLVAFHSERVKNACRLEGKPLPDAICIPCGRYSMQLSVWSAKCLGGKAYAEGSGRLNLMANATNHANEVNKPSEYRADQCFLTGLPETHGLVLTRAMHVRKWLTPVWSEREGVYWLRQTGYGTPAAQLDEGQGKDF